MCSNQYAIYAEIPVIITLYVLGLTLFLLFVDIPLLHAIFFLSINDFDLL